jgi:hypothetical protein
MSLTIGVAVPALHHLTPEDPTRRDDRVVRHGRGHGGDAVSPGGAWLTNHAASHRLALLAVPGLEADPHTLRTRACITAPTSMAR